ncbi:MAG: hypothetical protein ABI559_08495 [Chloroflexota bacterium]
MTVRRDIEPADTNRTVRVVDHEQPVVVDRPVVVQDHQEAMAHEGERVTRRPSGYDLARGWMRTFNMSVAFILLLIESALAFRLAFKLGGANGNNGFVSFIYDVSNPFVSPFRGIANQSISGTKIFEPETLIAMGVWAAAVVLLIVLVNVITSAPASAETESVTRERYAHMDRKS